MRERSRKGFYFKYGENWGREHVCKLKHYKFVLVEDSGDEEVEECTEDKGETEVLVAKIL